MSWFADRRQTIGPRNAYIEVVALAGGRHCLPYFQFLVVYKTLNGPRDAFAADALPEVDMLAVEDAIKVHLALPR